MGTLPVGEGGCAALGGAQIKLTETLAWTGRSDVKALSGAADGAKDTKPSNPPTPRRPRLPGRLLEWLPGRLACRLPSRLKLTR